MSEAQEALVKKLIKARFDVTLALRTITDYLKRWSFTPQRPMKRATERQDPKVAEAGLSEDQETRQERRRRD
ncbi:MAG: helix-turn-helix domain-containing protein, partial [Geminicoccaceae bacterium]